MKRLLLLALTLIAIISVPVSAKNCAKVKDQPKYVFLFIGDGMGVNHVNMTQMYKAAMNGIQGTEDLCFTSFPVAGIATTYSDNDLVTDSAASGTAIATGHKTKNGRVGQTTDEQPLYSVAYYAKQAGKKVGIMSNLSLLGATPAAFYAHQKSRSSYRKIFSDILECGFDYFAGSEILDNDEDEHTLQDRTERLQAAGIAFAHNGAEFESLYKDAKQLLLSPCVREPEQLVLDNRPSRMGLDQMLQSGIKFLMKDGCKQGFFIMAEQDSIDGQSHGNDAASVVKEVLDFEVAIQVAIDFYRQHPAETAIIITADHETGGIVLKGHKASQYRLLAEQKVSQVALTGKLRAMMHSQKEPLSWEQVKNLLKENLGFWDTIALSSDEENELLQVYNETVARNESGHVTDDFNYNDNADIVYSAVKLLDRKAGIYFRDGGHSSGMVPVYAIGPGTEIFCSQNQNSDIGPKIAKIAGYGEMK